MKAKQYLSQLHELEKNIMVMHLNRKEMLYRATSIGTSMNPNKVQTTKRHDNMENAIISAADISREIEYETLKLMEMQNTIINQIQTLDNVLYMQILFKHYVQYKVLQTVSKELDNSYQYIRHTHGKALKAFEKRFADVLEEADHDGSNGKE